jgi:hypothetical protein
MKINLAAVLGFVCILAIGSSSAWAQGRVGAGRGLGMAAGQASAAAGAGMAHATQAAANAGAHSSAAEAAGRPSALPTQQLGRQPDRLSRDFTAASGVAAGMGRGAAGWQTSSGATATAFSSARGAENAVTSAGNWDRIQQQRNQQAEHLRMISEQNGKMMLAATADRMEGNAQRNFDRQHSVVTQVGPTAQTVGTAAPVNAAASRPASAPSRGFWFRSR